MKSLTKIILFLFLGIKINGQMPILLQEAYQKALEHNLDIKNSVLRSEYQDKIKKSARVMDPLSISGELGQFNSKEFDNRFAVSQTLRLPGFYQKQQQVLLEEWKLSLISVNFQKWQLKKEISLVFN